MPKLAQVSFSAGEISPGLHSRVDLARFLSALKTCRNFIVLPTGGVQNRAGTEYIYTLNPDSLAKLAPFIRAEDDAYMLVLQEEIVLVFRDGGFLPGAVPLTVTNAVKTDVFVETISAEIPIEGGGSVTVTFDVYDTFVTYTMSAPHGLVAGNSVTVSAITYTGTLNPNTTAFVYDVPSAATFRLKIGSQYDTLTYGSGGVTSQSVTLVTPYQSDELAAIRYTQSADVMTLAHRSYYPSEITRSSATAFAFATITDITNGPFLEVNSTATTMTASAVTGSGITLTASTSVFTAGHIGALVIIYLTDLGTMVPWQANTAAALGAFWESDGKLYEALNAATTGTIPPTHSVGDKSDGSVVWRYTHSMYGIARITAQAGTTATADVLSRLPIVSPTTTTDWAFGAWSIDQGYPGNVTYWGDRLTFARSVKRPQTQWASKTGNYHDFGFSVPGQADDAITQTLNSRQTNAIVDLVPLEQLVSLTANSSWASPARGEVWTPETVGFFPQSNRGAADLSTVMAGDNAIMAEKGARKLRELSYAQERDKFGGQELTVLARHLFEEGTIVDMAYADDPDGILWVVRSDGGLVGVTYLPEQDVIAFHRHDTDGYFENVCVIPEDGRDAVYFVVRRTVGGETVRYLERLAARSNDQYDAMFVDCSLSFDGRNETATTITASGASYDGGATVTLTASASLFEADDVDDAIQFGTVHAIITAYTSATVVTAELQSPLGEDLQAVATTEWAFARNSFTDLSHLNGLIATGLMDGNHIAPGNTTTQGIVTSGRLELTYPAAVVHIGLFPTQEIQTLTLNIPGGAQIRDNAKIVSKVSVVVENTVGIKVGPDEDNLEEIATRATETYTEPNALQTGVQTAYLLATLDKDSSILIRQSVPKPATILAVIPHVTVGNNG